MIEQKQVIQLIGNWGYTPSQFRSYLDKQIERAKDLGEAVGATMYSSLLTLSKYSLSGDADSAVEKNKLSSHPEVKELIDDDEISGIIDDDDFSSGVIDAVYEECIKYGNLESAEIAMREKVMFMVAPMLTKKIVEIGSHTSEQILQCFIGADHNMQYDDSEDTLRKVSSNLNSLASIISRFSEEIKMCEETSFEPFNDISDAIIGDVDSIMLEINQDMLSIIGNPPHVWTSYSISFGKMMAGFLIALSFGYVTYEDYEDVIKNFKSATVPNESKVEPPIQNIKFVRN
jgi:hypothetical protein